MSIAYDASSNNTSGSGTSTTVSHTISGADPLFVAGGQDRINAATCVTSVTYNGVNLTSLGGIQRNPSSRYTSDWYLLGPSTGTNNFTVNKSISTYHGFNGTSYNGVKQTGNPYTQSVQRTTTTTTSYAHSLTVGLANYQLLGVFTGDTISASTDTVCDNDLSLGNYSRYRRTEASVSNGSFALTISRPTAAHFASVVSAWEEAGGGGGGSPAPSLMMLGVGS